MKRFSNIKEGFKTLDVQDNTINSVKSEDIQKYLEIARKFLSEEGLYVCGWLISHENYEEELNCPEGKNALEFFFSQGHPNEKKLQKLYKSLEKLDKERRLLEVPLFQTKQQFDDIMSKKISPDEILLDLVSEKGRNEIAKKYTPLVHKIARSWVGKTAFDYDQLVSYAYEGLIWAMDGYGKKSNKQKKREELGGEEIDMDKYKSYTFLSFAAQMIRCRILDAAKNDSRIVRIPISQQNKTKEEQGFLAKSNTISGDQPIQSGDDEGQTLFNIVGGIENPGIKIDKEEIDKLWDDICKALEEKFGQKTMDIFYNYFGWGGRKKLTGKEMAKKYGYKSPASITAEVVKVINFIKKDKNMFARFTDIYELMREHQEDLDEYDEYNSNYSLNINEFLNDEKQKNNEENNDETFFQ